jgi:hypothetical protein
MTSVLEPSTPARSLMVDANRRYGSLTAVSDIGDFSTNYDVPSAVSVGPSVQSRAALLVRLAGQQFID